MRDGIRRRMWAAVLGGLMLCGSVPHANAQVIGHAEVNRAADLPPATVEAIRNQVWFFTHASVGGNMLKGMDALRKENPSKFPLRAKSVSYSPDGRKVADRPDDVTPGTIYECNRRNPGWAAKYEIFRKAIAESNWNGSPVQFAMDKLCYVDPDADPARYIEMMSRLEKEFPQTTFVYTTLPLRTEEDSANVKRNNYNQAVRKFAVANNRLLLDIADIQAHDPQGNPVTFTRNGKTYQKLHAAYTNDGGHLNTEGAKRVALGWYAVAATKAK